MARNRIGLFNKMRSRRNGFAVINNKLADGLLAMKSALPGLVEGADALKAKAYSPQGNPTDGDLTQLDRLMTTIRATVKAEKELELALGIGEVAK